MDKRVRMVSILITETTIPKIVEMTGITAESLTAIMAHDETWQSKAYFLVDQDSVPKYKLDATKSVLKDREKELLKLKGPCPLESCPLHYAHSGPCNPEVAYYGN